jgi:hypothetical protein
MAHPLDGIWAKLNRADENIGNLNSEIVKLLGEKLYPILKNLDNESFQKAVDDHSSVEVPLRFSILAGEIVHQMRSSLDHLAWLLSSESYRESDGKRIEFPVMIETPDKGELARYEKKTNGISSTSARALVKLYQPCYGPDPLNSPLTIVHDMDRFDKHRELVLVVPAFKLHFRYDDMLAYIAHKKAEAPADVLGELERAVQMNAQLTRQIAFQHFGTREPEPVIPGLHALLEAVRSVIEAFEPEFK